MPGLIDNELLRLAEHLIYKHDILRSDEATPTRLLVCALTRDARMTMGAPFHSNEGISSRRSCSD